MAPPVWQLCQAGNLEGVREALERGGDVNECDQNGVTGLMWATTKNFNRVVELLLLQPGININQQDNSGSTALHNAMVWEDIAVISMLVDDHRMRSLNTRDGHGRTPLMEAVWWGRVSCVRYLVMVQGVSLETWDAEGRSLEEASRASPLGRDGQVAMLLQVARQGWSGPPSPPSTPSPPFHPSPSSPPSDEEEPSSIFECPVCLEVMVPPKRILQCRNGHLICGDCRGQLQRACECPRCREEITGRATDLETIIRTVYAPS